MNSSEEPLDLKQSSIESKLETNENIPISTRPETIIALEMMKNILSGATITLSPTQQQQIITEIKLDSTFIENCQLTPQKVCLISYNYIYILSFNIFLCFISSFHLLLKNVQ